jgi:hypothetical protein
MFNASEKDKIICFKLVSGDEVIARLVQLKLETIVINSPRVVALQLGQQGNMGVMLIPLSVNSLKGDYEINNKAVVGRSSTVDPDLERQYITATTGIALAR